LAADRDVMSRAVVRRSLLALALVVTLATTTRAAQIEPHIGPHDGPHDAATLSGAIVDEAGGGVPQVVVVAFNATLGVRRIATTTESGAFAIPLLPAGTYIVTADTPQFAPVDVRNVELRPRDHLVLTIRLRLKTEDTRVDVVGTLTVVRDGARAPLVARGGAVEATLIDGALQRLLPLSSRRDWADFFRLTPGTVSGLEYGGVVRYHWRGSDAGSHAFLIDGVDVTSAFSNTGRLITLNPAAIQEVRIGSGAMDAAVPLAAGAVIDVRTRSGTNRTAGDLAFVYEPQSWNADNSHGGSSASVALAHTEAAWGGPVRADRVWWFGASHGARQTVGISRSPDQIASLRSVSPRFQPFGESGVTSSAFVKITGRVGTAHQLSAFYERDANPQDANSRLNAGNFVRRIYGGTGLALSVDSMWTNALSGRLTVSYNNKSAPTEFVLDNAPSRPVHQSSIVSGRTVSGTGAVAVLGNVSSAVDTPYDMSTIAAAVTYESRGDRRHRLQLGTALQPRLHEETVEKYANGGFALEELVMDDAADPAAGLIPFHRRIYTVPDAVVVRVDSRDYAFYAQDLWRLSDRLTVGAGVRTDIIRRTDRLLDREVQRSNEIGPRVNVAYAFDDARRHVLRATWGRAQETLAISSTSVAAYRPPYRDSYDTDLDGRFETTFVVPSLLAASVTRTFDAARHQPYVDEWTLGHAWQIDALTSVAATFAHRDYRDRNTAVETNAIYAGTRFVGYRDPSVNQIYQVTNNTWNWPVYSSLELELAKTMDRLQLRSNYSRQWRHLAGTWQPGDPAAILQPDAFPNAGGLGRINGVPSNTLDANSLSGFNMIDGAQWRDHVFTLTASALAPLGLRVATSYTYQSGPWSGPIVTRIAAPDFTYGPPIVVLPTGRTVANPLSTFLRFAYPTRTDGQFTLPGLHLWNVRVGHVFPRRGWRLETAIDVLNLTNHGADQSLEAGGNQLFSPMFGRGWLRQPPRAAQASIRVAF
jgi:hypothetical protein